MKQIKIVGLVLSIAFLAACENANTNRTANTNTGNANAANVSASPQTQTLSEVETPARIRGMVAQRGEQDAAAPTLKIVEPKEAATVGSSTVKVKLELGGELKGYQPMKDPATGMGNHIHVILDNQPYEAYYNLDEPFELRNVTEGKHTLRVFASRPWHESYKNEGALDREG